MYRATRPLLSLLGGALLVLSPCGAARAQAPGGTAVIVPLYGTVRLQMSSRLPIAKVVNPKENSVRIRGGDPTVLMLTGQQPDVVRLELTDVNGRTETYEIIVQPDVEYLQVQLRRAVPTANVTIIPLSNSTVLLK